MEKVKKVRSKHVGYAAQREFCRNNNHTYTEKLNSLTKLIVCGEAVLMCNYPFPDPYHKKGVCRASTCTDMREIPAEITEADEALSSQISASQIPASEEKAVGGEVIADPISASEVAEELEEGTWPTQDDVKAEDETEPQLVRPSCMPE
jgi:DNA-directed RNA polymerase subunit L